MQGWRSDAFGDEAGLQHQAFATRGFPEGETGIASMRAEQHIERTTDERVIPGEEGFVLAGEGTFAVEGEGEAFIGQRGQGIGDEIVWTDEPGTVRHLLDVHAEVIEQADEEALEVETGIDITDALNQACGEARLAGVEFEEAVVAAFEFFSALRGAVCCCV